MTAHSTRIAEAAPRYTPPDTLADPALRAFFRLAEHWKLRIAEQRRSRIERRIHFDLRQQFLSPSGTKDGHAAFLVPNVNPVPGEQETSPDRCVRIVLPELGAGCRVQTMNYSAHVANV